MVVVLIIATFSASALWYQWRSAEIEEADRSRTEAAWVLVGALDWAQLILREDARAGGADHLAEPWAVPLGEIKLTSFLMADRGVARDVADGFPDAMLSGEILDAQAKLNVRNLVQNGQPVRTAVAAFQKLFALLGLPETQVATLVEGVAKAALRASTAPDTARAQGTVASAGVQAALPTASDGTPLMPHRVEELVWLGLPAATVEAIAPYVTVLPSATTLNINTATAEALYAAVPGLDMAGARLLVDARRSQYFASLVRPGQLVQSLGASLVAGQHGIASQYFEVRARLRIERTTLEQRSLILRNGTDVALVWSERGGVRPERLAAR